ncbi:O-methyltransferase-domain-containing protein [Macrophomina phaseolina]|uniref:O-methyltransferase-domain-containing protein n=1 Tax=Macrophomina phaseolina TaxID=35725 RepID=A0ABQ8GB56_9PEZI|nr:O-methyltransferase-domain-containing protein [Macrophomina phaseolina]
MSSESRNIDEQLSSLNSYLERACQILKTEEGVLPDLKVSRLADKSLDLVYEIGQMLDPGHLTLADNFLAYVPTKCLVGVVDLGIADKLQQAGPMQVAELADACGARADRLHQVLRVLCSNGIFAYDKATQTYRNNHTSTLITKDHWTQWHLWVTLYGNQFYDMARGIPAALKKDTVRTPAQVEYDTDMDVFTYFRTKGWDPLLHKTLGAGATAQAPGILADYPWEEVANETVMDIGGGGGALIALLLRGHKTMRGALFELPHIIDLAKPFFRPGGQYADIADRVPEENLVAGSFFEKIAPATVYTIKWTLHNWKRDDAIRILTNVRNALIPGPNSRLIVLESILDTTRSSRLARHGDMNMMIAANGLERTMEEWIDLADRSGWEIKRVHPLRNAWPCAIDLRPKTS